jgi:hypothetical protein
MRTKLTMHYIHACRSQLNILIREYEINTISTHAHLSLSRPYHIHVIMKQNIVCFVKIYLDRNHILVRKLKYMSIVKM